MVEGALPEMAGSVTGDKPRRFARRAAASGITTREYMESTAAEQHPLLKGIVERTEQGLVVLGPANSSPVRRLLHVNAYGGQAVWNKVKQGLVPPHQLLGCLELARMCYEVALAEPLPDFYLYRHPIPHDLKLLGFIRSWLGPDGIVYCGHNVLFWLPMLRALGAIRNPIISLLYAREPLDWSRAHRGIIALTPAAAEQARKLAPRATVAVFGAVVFSRT